MAKSNRLAEKLRGIRVMVSELASAADDRLNDLDALSASIDAAIAEAEGHTI